MSIPRHTTETYLAVGAKAMVIRHVRYLPCSREDATAVMPATGFVRWLTCSQTRSDHRVYLEIMFWKEPRVSACNFRLEYGIAKQLAFYYRARLTLPPDI